MSAASILASALLICTAPVVTDGDSIRCGDGTRLRLAGIDAPDKPDYCAKRKRVCTIEQWRASKASLSSAVRGRAVTYRYAGRDKYGRTVALVYAGGRELSCLQIKSGHAEFKPTWNGNLLMCNTAGGAR